MELKYKQVDLADLETSRNQGWSFGVQLPVMVDIK